MKKILALLMAGLMTATAMAGCSGGQSSTTNDSASNTSAGGDLDYIKNKGEMVIGITYFEPMNYMDENGKLTGFETEFATAVCDELGVTPKFQKIDWESKEVELNAKTIDCIWNGLTIDDERKSTMSITTPYMENKQVMVTKADNASKYTSADALAGATVVAEKKSAGETVAKTDEFFKQATYVSVDAQAKALLEVKSGTADIAIIDYVMSIGTLRDGSDYSELSVVESQSFAPEQYGIAFRKGSDVTEKVNEAMQTVANSGKLNEIAEKYSLQDLLLVKSK